MYIKKRIIENIENIGIIVDKRLIKLYKVIINYVFEISGKFQERNNPLFYYHLAELYQSFIKEENVWFGHHEVAIQTTTSRSILRQNMYHGYMPRISSTI